uniref:G-protein coupled receptors family 3 profile domain-containing protein n=1 Tax=Xenopus tropicalis TaxID=8364 RepID=A0A803KIU4_XENTR
MLATILLVTFSLLQISYGATDPFLSDRATFPYFFRTVQSKKGQYFAISQLLKYFGWTWVGIITTDDINGDESYQLLSNYLSSEGICIEFSLKLYNQNIPYEELQHKSTSVVIFCGTINLKTAVTLWELPDIISDKTFIFTSDLIYYSYLIYYALTLFNGSLIIIQNRADYIRTNARLRQFIASVHPSMHPEDKLLEAIWLLYHSCMAENMSLTSIHKRIYPPYLPDCTGEERLTDLQAFNDDFHTRNMIIAVQAMILESSKMHYRQNLITEQESAKNRKVIHFKHQGQFLKSFNENGELVSPYHINNLFITNDYLSDKKIGLYIPWAPPNQKLNITHNEIIWKTESNKVPRAQCSDNCLPGFRKALKPGAQSCCYDCVLCSEGEISNRTDSENCFRCPDTEWPNANKNVCIVKGAEFLSYTNDVISVFFSSISVLLFVITLLILGIFIIYRDTPIVRANNRSLSFLLLVSIKLSFLSVFLFLGRPVDITCMLRIITFGITFSIAVSSLLAKTIMVCVAFKATKPGSSWRKWLGVKLSNSVVLFCSSIQIIICMTWLAISPPFQELDIHTSPGTIIIQCNEGSAIGFYSVIGYMGLLAAVSFVLAFLARSLPDSFNEAKYITFSMLLFCSVWITMIPAYLSTKGKNTVCVEIFAILTSSAGLQGCIFLPKCYTILFRPEINSKSFLRVNKFC